MCLEKSPASDVVFGASMKPVLSRSKRLARENQKRPKAHNAVPPKTRTIGD